MSFAGPAWILQLSVNAKMRLIISFATGELHVHAVRQALTAVGAFPSKTSSTSSPQQACNMLLRPNVTSLLMTPSKQLC
jgi:hypothetical protein